MGLVHHHVVISRSSGLLSFNELVLIVRSVVLQVDRWDVFSRCFDFGLVNMLSEHAFHLQDNWSTERLVSGVAEGESDFILFLVISYHVHSHSERHRDGNGGLAVDFLLDWNFENFDR